MTQDVSQCKSLIVTKGIGALLTAQKRLVTHGKSLPKRAVATKQEVQHRVWLHV